MGSIGSSELVTAADRGWWDGKMRRRTMVLGWKAHLAHFTGSRVFMEELFELKVTEEEVAVARGDDDYGGGGRGGDAGGQIPAV